MIRNWLEDGPGAHTIGVVLNHSLVSWETAERLVAEELTQFVLNTETNRSTADHMGGRRRAVSSCAESCTPLLECYNGGYTRSGQHVQPCRCRGHSSPCARWHYRLHFPRRGEQLLHTDLMVAFGGLPVKNGQIGQGGVGRHHQQPDERGSKRRGQVCQRVTATSRHDQCAER